MASAKSFEELRIWQEARKLIRQVYQTTESGSLAEKGFGFRGQIQRAAVSIMNNIAEGFERGTDAEFSRFLSIGKGSCGEVRSLLYVAQDMKYVSVEEAAQLRKETISISGGIYASIKHLKGK